MQSDIGVAIACIGIVILLYQRESYFLLVFVSHITKNPGNIIELYVYQSVQLVKLPFRYRCLLGGGY